MSLLEVVQLVLYFTLLLVCTPLLGGYMARVFQGERTWLKPPPPPTVR